MGEGGAKLREGAGAKPCAFASISPSLASPQPDGARLGSAEHVGRCIGLHVRPEGWRVDAGIPGVGFAGDGSVYETHWRSDGQKHELCRKQEHHERPRCTSAQRCHTVDDIRTLSARMQQGGRAPIQIRLSSKNTRVHFHVSQAILALCFSHGGYHKPKTPTTAVPA